MNTLFRGLFAALALVTLSCQAAGPASSITDGKEYKRVANVVAPADAKRVTVEEFFWYGCPHCFQAEDAVEAWAKAKPAYIDFSRMPNTLGRPIGELHARTYYILESLGQLNKLHRPFFESLHVKRLAMDTPDSVRGFFVANGVKAEDFDKATSSFMVDSRMRRAEQLARTYVITSVPTFVVGGKYYTNVAMAGGHEKLGGVINALAAKVMSERK